MPFRTHVALALSFALAFALPAAMARAAAPPPDTIDARLLACTGCHGDQGRATADGFYPRIAGKPAGYLANQLLNFRDGRRAVPSMGWMVAHLSDDYLREIAAHFASRHPPHPAPPPPAVSPEVLERGRRLVVQGDASRQLPSCTACHGDIGAHSIAAAGEPKPVLPSVTRFDADHHPPFQSLAADPGRVKFSHGRHMRAGLTLGAGNGADKVAWTYARLPAADRQVVERASVIGTEFARGPLEALAGAEAAGRLGGA